MDRNNKLQINQSNCRLRINGKDVLRVEYCRGSGHNGTKSCFRRRTYKLIGFERYAFVHYQDQ